MAKSPQPRIEINLEEIYHILDSARRQPMSEPEYEKVKTAVAALAEKAASRSRTTERTDAVLPHQDPDKHAAKEPEAKRKPPKSGHGRNGAARFTGAKRVIVAHATLQSGDRCPECQKGKVYRQKKPKTLIRITGRPPLEATAYELEQLRCNGCGQVFTAEAPVQAGEKKYDESAVAMIAQLRYGSGVPFQRLERLEGNLGIPLPAATQWEVVEEKAETLRPALEELLAIIRERCFLNTARFGPIDDAAELNAQVVKIALGYGIFQEFINHWLEIGQRTDTPQRRHVVRARLAA
jgi:transposase